MTVSQSMTHSSPYVPRASLFALEAGRVSWRMWAIWLAGFGVFSMMIPRDASFDVVHYHLHNGWAALNGRDGQDLAPAEMHSFLNPVWQVFVWGLIELLPGRFVAFVLGILQALVLPALYALTRRLLVRAGSAPAMVTVGAISVSGFLAETQFGLMGSVRNDAVFAGGLIAGLALLFPDNREGPDRRALLVASFLVASLMGMKLTNAVYVVFFAVTALVIFPDWRARLHGAACCLAGGLAGLFLFGGPWAMQMLADYGNPIFPNLNGYFNAPLGPDTPFRDTRYLPSGVLEALLRPFLFLFDGEKVNEHDFFDPRLQLTYVCCVVLIIASGLKLVREQTGAPRAAIAIGAGALAAILVWTLTFSISRYMAAAWLIGPTMLVFTLAMFDQRLIEHPRAPLVAIAGTVGLVLMTQPFESRRVPWTSWTERYVEADIPLQLEGADTLIAFSGGYPGAFLAPFFSESVRLTHLVPQDWSAPALANYRVGIREQVRSPSTDLYVVIADTQDHFFETHAKLLEAESVQVDRPSCQAIATNMGTADAQWKICRAAYAPK